MTYLRDSPRVDVRTCSIFFFVISSSLFAEHFSIALSPFSLSLSHFLSLWEPSHLVLSSDPPFSPLIALLAEYGATWLYSPRRRRESFIRRLLCFFPRSPHPPTDSLLSRSVLPEKKQSSFLFPRVSESAFTIFPLFHYISRFERVLVPLTHRARCLREDKIKIDFPYEFHTESDKHPKSR